MLEEIDDNGSWTLPAERSKNGKAHQLPLLPMAIEIVKSVPQRVTRDHLFGARTRIEGSRLGTSASGSSSQRVGFDDWTLHDFRRTLSTRLHDMGVAPHVCEQILNHQGHRGSVGAVYNQSRYEREVRAAWRCGKITSARWSRVASARSFPCL